MHSWDVTVVIVGIIINILVIIILDENCLGGNYWWCDWNLYCAVVAVLVVRKDNAWWIVIVWDR